MTASNVSCVIPTHNRSHFLAESLASVAAQTTPPAEIIVVSDIVDDASRQVCDDFSVKSAIPLHYVEYSDKPSGASPSRNRGAAAATGDFIAFLDDDDTWDPPYLERALASISATGSAMSVTWIEMFMNAAVKPGPSIAPGLGPKDVVAINPGATGSNMVVERAVFEKLGGFDAELRMKNDTDFFFRFVKAGHAYSVVDERLVNQRKHDSGQLTGHSAARADNTEAYVRKHRADLSFGDRRHLAFVVHRIRRHSSTSRVGKLWHLGMSVLTYSRRQYREDRANRTDSAFFAVPAIADSPRHETGR